MGSSQSTRKITLVNDDKAGVIKLSESLAHRLRGQLNEGQSAVTTVAAAENQAPEPLAHSPSIPDDIQPPVVLTEHSVAGSSEPITPPLIAPTVPESLIPPPSERPVESTSPTAPLIPDGTPQPSASIPYVSDGEGVSSTIPQSIIHSVPSVDNGQEPSVPVQDVTPPPIPPPAFLPPTPPPTPPAVVTPIIEEPPQPPIVQETPVETIIDVTPAITLKEVDKDTASNDGTQAASMEGNGHATWSLYVEEAHLAMLRLREEKDEYIRLQEQQWRERLANREKEYMDQAQLTESSLTSSIKNVESLFLKTTCTPVCQDRQDEVMQCFADHPKQSLRCSETVRQFSKCVNVSQLQAVLKEKTS